MIDGRMSILEGSILARQQHTIGREGNGAGALTYPTFSRCDIGLVNKQFLLRLGQQVPVPIADGVVFVIFHVVDNHLLITPQNYARCRIVSILVRHHVEQLHGTMRGCRDGQRNIYRLTIGIRSTCISRDILVVDID